MRKRLREPFAPLLEHEQLLMISISTVLVMAGQGVISPVLPLFADEFDVSIAAIGLTLSFFGLARLILNVPLGVLSDRYGRRLLLVAGPLITAVGMIGSGLSGSLTELLIWRFVAGAGSAMYMTGAQIYLADISSPATRARFIGTNQSALLLGVSIGPAIGGLIAEAWGLRTPFYVVGVGALVAMVYAYWRLPETRHLAFAQAPAGERVEPGGPAPEGRAWVRLVTSKDFAAVSFITMAIFLTRTASRQTLMPLLASARFGLSAGGIGAIFTVMSVVNLVLIAPASIVADRAGRKWAIVPAGLVVAAGLLLVAGSGTLALFVVGGIVVSIGTAMSGPAPAAYVADISPPDQRGLGMGLYRSAGDFGFLIGPPLLGALADRTSFGWGLSTNALLIAVAAVTFAVVARETAGRSLAASAATAPATGGGER